jgi:two-component system, NtrC family, sensor kinase
MFDERSQNNKLQLLGKLNASFVHEIRNPLFALKLNLDYINSLDNIPTEIRDSFSSCTEAVERMEILVNNILDFSRKNNSKPDYCSVNEVTLQAIHLLEGYAHKTFCQVKEEFSETIPQILFDKNKLLQVILNLITNAIEASEESRQIIVKTYQEKPFLIWEVEDFGSGIKEDDRQMVFDEFFTRKTNGTGLGLSICKKLLTESDAELDFDSSPGKGTRFFIKFKTNNSSSQE